MSSKMKHDIADKIKKLLQLAGNNPNEAEAAAAMAKAQELLQQHNLSMVDIRKKQAQDQAAQAGEGRTKAKVEKSAMFHYQRDLWKVLAETNYCVYYPIKIYTHGVFATYHHALIGREDNVATVTVMGSYLEQWVNKACPYQSGKDVNLWKQGAVERIGDRLRAQVHETETSDGWSSDETQTTALALRNVRDGEVHGNYMFMTGGAGTYCPCQACVKERRAKWQAEQLKRPIETYVEKPLTEAQKAAQERAKQRYWDRWQKEQDADRAKRNSEAFRRGQQDGDKVNLNKQVKK